MMNGGKIRLGAVMTGLLWMEITLLSCATVRKPAKTPAASRSAASAAPAGAAPGGYADSLFVAAEMAKLGGLNDKAKQLFQAFVGLRPRSGAGYYELALVNGDAGDPTETLGYARRAARLDPSNSWYAIAYANALAMNKDYDSAAVIFGHLASAQPDEHRFLYNEAVMLSDAGAYSRALALFDTLESQLGINEEFVFQKQRIFLKMGEPDSAAAEISALIRSEPDNARYYALLAQVYADDNRPKKAMEVYRTLLDRDPGNPQAMVAVGLFYKKQGDDSLFRRYMSAAFSNPRFGAEDKMAFMYPYLKYVEIDTSQREEALTLCRMVVDASPDDPRVLALYGDMLFQSGLPDSAMVQYRRSMAVSDTLYEVWNQMMLVYAVRGQTDSLVEMSGRAVAHFPEEGGAWYYRGMGLLLAGKPAESTAPLSRALRLPIADAKLKSRIYASLAEAYHTLNRNGPSDSCFRAAIALNPRDDLVLNNYSYYLAERNEDLPDALEMIRAAVRLKPGEGTYEDTYAWVLYHMGDFRQAQVWMEKALRSPGGEERPGYLEHYGDILYKNDDKRGALASWKEAQAHGGDSPGLTWKISHGKLPGTRRQAKMNDLKKESR